MSENLEVAPVAETENTATELTNDTPEIVTPEPDATPEEPQESEEAKAIKRMQRRIDKRTADVYRERAEKEQLAQRIAALEAERTPAEESTPNRVDPVVLAKEIARAERVNERCNDIAAKGRKDFPDFTAAIEELGRELPLFDGKGKPTPAMEVVLEADNPPALLHYLGKNPDLASELADLTPTQIARRLDRIEREMATPKTSAAPKPLTPIKAQAADTGLASAKSDKEWAEMRERELAEKRKRN